MFSKKFLTFLFLILSFTYNIQANQFRENADKLGISLSGHFIDETLKNQNGKYVLPSNSWFKKNINSDKAIFYKSGSAFGDWNGDNKLDYLVFGVDTGAALVAQQETSLNQKEDKVVLMEMPFITL